MNELEIKKKLLIISFLILGVICFGTIGYMTLEDLKFLDALYMTVITVATVGFREVK